MKGMTNATNNPPVIIYGLEVDTSISSTPNNVSFTRGALGMSFAQRAELYTKHFKPCVVSRSTGDVNYYLDPSDGTKKLDGSSAVLTGSDGDVCVCIDTIWYRTLVNGTKQSFEFAFKDPSAIGEVGFDCWCHKYGSLTLPYVFAGVFKATGNTTACYSVNSSDKPARSMTEYQFETAFKATGANTPAQYLGVGLPERALIGMMLIFLSGSTNSQGFYGNGYVGATSSEANLSATNLGFNATSMLVSGDTSGSLSGVMSGFFNNLWGNAWEFLHQCAFDNYKVKTTYLHNDHVANITTASYATLPSTWYESTSTMASASSTGWSYASSFMMADAPCCTFPRNLGGSTGTYVYDGIYVNTGALTDRCVIAGGALHDGAPAGLFALSVDYALGYSHWSIGSRLLIRPIQLAR